MFQKDKLKSKIHQAMEYHIDEELSRDRILKKSKKRKLNSSLEMSQQQKVEQTDKPNNQTCRKS
jgi:hypothetical protein